MLIGKNTSIIAIKYFGDKPKKTLINGGTHFIQVLEDSVSYEFTEFVYQFKLLKMYIL